MVSRRSTHHRLSPVAVVTITTIAIFFYITVILERENEKNEMRKTNVTIINSREHLTFPEYLRWRKWKLQRQGIRRRRRRRLAREGKNAGMLLNVDGILKADPCGGHKSWCCSRWCSRSRGVVDAHLNVVARIVRANRPGAANRRVGVVDEGEGREGRVWHPRAVCAPIVASLVMMMVRRIMIAGEGRVKFGLLVLRPTAWPQLLSC